MTEAERKAWNAAIEAMRADVQLKLSRLPHYQQHTENKLNDKVEEGYGNALVNVLAAIRALAKPEAT